MAFFALIKQPKFKCGLLGKYMITLTVLQGDHRLIIRHHKYQRRSVSLNTALEVTL